MAFWDLAAHQATFTSALEAAVLLLQGLQPPSASKLTESETSSGSLLLATYTRSLMHGDSVCSAPSTTACQRNVVWVLPFAHCPRLPAM